MNNVILISGKIYQLESSNRRQMCQLMSFGANSYSSMSGKYGR